MNSQVSYNGVHPETWVVTPLPSQVEGVNLYEVQETVNEGGPQCVVSVSGPFEATLVHSSRPLSEREAARARVAAKRNYWKYVR